MKGREDVAQRTPLEQGVQIRTAGSQVCYSISVGHGVVLHALHHPHYPTCRATGAAPRFELPAAALTDRSAVSYQVPADAALRFRYWDGECVLFHGASGDTHRVPEAVGQLIEQLATAASSTVGELSAAIDLHTDDVKRALVELERLGIVEPAP